MSESDDARITGCIRRMNGYMGQETDPMFLTFLAAQLRSQFPPVDMELEAVASRLEGIAALVRGR